jgi:hypothetical protein
MKTQTHTRDEAALDAWAEAALEEAEGEAEAALEALLGDAGHGRLVGAGLLPSDEDAGAVLWAAIERVCGGF